MGLRNSSNGQSTEREDADHCHHWVFTTGLPGARQCSVRSGCSCIWVHQSVNQPTYAQIHISCRWIREFLMSNFWVKGWSFKCLVQMWVSWICSWLVSSSSQKTLVVKRKPKRMPTSLCWTRLCLCTDGTVMRKCMPAATNTQGEGSTSSSLTTPTLCGGPNQSTTESIILDKDVTTESGV